MLRSTKPLRRKILHILLEEEMEDKRRSAAEVDLSNCTFVGTVMLHNSRLLSAKFDWTYVGKKKWKTNAGIQLR